MNTNEVKDVEFRLAMILGFLKQCGIYSWVEWKSCCAGRFILDVKLSPINVEETPDSLDLPCLSFVAKGSTPEGIANNFKRCVASFAPAMRLEHL